MYILPDATIKIYENVPFDSNYQNTCLFASASAQRSYFNGLPSKTFTKFTYQRANRDYIQVSGIADDYFNVNYLSFQNTPTSKIFYCFVDSVQYVNVGCARLSITIDVLQTYMFDYTLLDSFVEREHSVTDNIGDNIVPEGIETGPLIATNISTTPISSLIGDYSIVVVTTLGDDGDTPANGGLVGLTNYKVYSGAKLESFTADDSGVKLLNSYLNILTKANKSDAVVSIFMMPSAFISGQQSIDFSVSMPDTVGGAPGIYDGYRPKNKKLFTSPFCSLVGTNYNGQTINWTFENFAYGNSVTPSEIHFSIFCDYSPSPTLVVEPSNYADVGKINRLYFSAFPQCSYNIDAYQSYLAATQSTRTLTSINAITSGVIGGAKILTGNIVGGVTQYVGGFSGVFNSMVEMSQKSTEPPYMRGNISNSSPYTSGIKGPDIFFYTVRADMAKKIDDYFNMYGYATHELKVPNRNSRPHWNFVKVNVLNISGNIPADVKQELDEIYSRGVTFWKTPSEIGNYSLDNSPS